MCCQDVFHYCSKSAKLSFDQSTGVYGGPFGGVNSQQSVPMFSHETNQYRKNTLKRPQESSDIAVI